MRSTFRWIWSTRLFVHGNELHADASPDSSIRHELLELRDAVRAGDEFVVEREGISRVAGGKIGYFRSRTAGTTSGAKTIRRSHRSWMESFEVNRKALGLGPNDRYGILGKAVHSIALYAILEAAHHGADIHWLAGMRADRQARLIAEAGVTAIYATPTQLRAVCDSGVASPALRYILCGGGHLARELRARIEARFPDAKLVEFYGSSETSFIAWGEGNGPVGSVGRPYPGVELRIEPLEGELGEIWVRSPYLFDSYCAGNSAETRWANGFLTIGEIGALDRDGFLTVAGRRNRMITIADQNVFPETIETFLVSDPRVHHCAVIPQADKKRGKVLVAVISGESGVVAGEDLLKRCREAFGALAAPRRVIALEDFPLTASGKPDLPKIAARFGDLS